MRDSTSTVKATAPRVVIPCDDMSLRLVDLLAQAPPDVASELQLQLAALIRESLGDPKYYGTSIERTLLPPAARALGVRVPERTVAMRPWYSILVPARTPDEVFDRLNHELVRVVALPDVRERLISIGMVPETSTPHELATNIRTEVARWGPIVKAAGIAQQ